MDQLRRALSGLDNENDEEANIISQASTSLSWKNRLIGFGVCFAIGQLFLVMGSITLFFSGFGMFAILYTIGNLLSLLSTCFLMGPLQQLKRMCAPTRAIATTVMLLCMVLTLVVAFFKNGALALIIVFIQFLATIWYSLSYIPLARDTVKKVFSSCVS